MTSVVWTICLAIHQIVGAGTVLLKCSMGSMASHTRVIVYLCDIIQPRFKLPIFEMATEVILPLLRQCQAPENI